MLTYDLEQYLAAIKENQNNAKPHYIAEDGKRVFFESHCELDRYYKYITKVESKQ